MPDTNVCIPLLPTSTNPDSVAGLIFTVTEQAESLVMITVSAAPGTAFGVQLFAAQKPPVVLVH